MEKENIYTLKNGLIPIPSPWVMPGLGEIKHHTDAFRYITEMVCKKYEVSEKAVFSRSRIGKYVKARQIIHSLLKNNFKELGSKYIGRMCGNRDHATVLHSCKSVANQVETNKLFKMEYNSLDRNIKINIDRFRQSSLNYPNRKWIKSNKKSYQ